MLYTILIENLIFETIIGILPKEREKSQRVIIDAICEYQDENFLDYALLKERIITLFVTKKYFLLEDALKDIPKILKQEFTSLRSIKLSIKKPDIFEDCIIGMQAKIVF